MKSRKKSIWTRDLSETKYGRILFRFVIPMLMLSHGIDALVSGTIEVKGVTFTGIDAVIYGLIFILLSVSVLSYTWIYEKRKIIIGLYVAIPSVVCVGILGWVMVVRFV